MVTKTQHSDQIMDALGNQTRRDILALLREQPRPVGEIAALLPVSRPAVSKHLRMLEEAGLVTFATAGTRNIFRLSPQGFATARAYLDTFWDEALTRFQQLAEAQTGFPPTQEEQSTPSDIEREHG